MIGPARYHGQEPEIQVVILGPRPFRTVSASVGFYPRRNPPPSSEKREFSLGRLDFVSELRWLGRGSQEVWLLQSVARLPRRRQQLYVSKNCRCR
jgi:hypothetical protein